MKISIFGTGYVGLVTGACLAEVGHQVMCVDIDEKKISDLKKGVMPIYESGLEDIVKRNHKEQRLLFTTDAKKGINFGTAIFCAVGTPPDKNHKADLQYVRAVATIFGENINEYKLFINKSTVPVGTGEICKGIISEKLEKKMQQSIPSAFQASPLKPKGRLDFDVVSNPEFLKEGVAVRDFMLPDRIVCGLESDKAKKIMKEIYKPFVRTNRPLFFTDIKSAEIIKYAANSFLATKISFINEIANFSELTGANISDISRGIGLDDRIGSRFLHAGIGYGGSCFPKDVQALIETGKEYDYHFEIISAVENVNERQKLRVVEKLMKLIHPPHPFSGAKKEKSLIKDLGLSGKTIAIWGLAFKPKTDDIRDAPSLAIINKLLELGVEKIQAYDPVAMDNVKKYYCSNPSPLHSSDVLSLEKGETKLIFGKDNYDSVSGADALLVLTEWDSFRMVEFKRIKKLMTGDIIIDGRNIWNEEEVEKYGFIYEGVGK